MSITLVDCACETRIHGDGSGVEVDYCDLHAAAPEMRAALEELEIAFDNWRKHECAGYDCATCDISRLSEVARAAIAKAEGRS